MGALIEVKNFAKAFGTRVVHTDVSFSVQQGECLGLIGGSGTGKSVLLRSLIGLEKPDHGEIWIDGVEVSKFSESDFLRIRQQVSYVFQGGALFDSLSVFDNIAFPLREHTQKTADSIEKEVHELLDRFDIRHARDLFPSHLSGGMQKRVGVARAIILKPKIILYDEPTAGLDPVNTRKMQSVIKDLSQTGVTSILVTHDLVSALKVCERIAVLSQGQINHVFNVSELMQSPQQVMNLFLGSAL